MKSVFEIITILVFLFCFTMLERLDDNNCYYNTKNAAGPAAIQVNNNGNSTVTAAAGRNATSSVKPAKYQLPSRIYAKVLRAK